MNITYSLLSMTITALIIDDEPLAIGELAAMLKAHTEIEVVGTAENYIQALQQINDTQPMVLFLDINMPDKSGFDLLEEMDNPPYVIFVTAHDRYAIKAFEVSALDYLMKPVNPQRLADAIEKAKAMLLKKQEQQGQKLRMDKRIFIKDGEQCFFVPLAEIFLLESISNYVQVYFGKNKPMLHKSLNYMEEKLPDDVFFRANRQQIINITFIADITPLFNGVLRVMLNNGVSVEISQRQSPKFRELTGV